jgi:hypothetical protein
VAASDDYRTRTGLKFLERENKLVIRAIALLQAPGLPRLTPGQILSWFTFRVDGNHYAGYLTQDQANKLYSYTGGCLRDFADAVASLVTCLNTAINDLSTGAIVVLANALGGCPPMTKTASAGASGGTIPLPVVGCCSFDTNQKKDGVTSDFCTSGLAGHWDPNPCNMKQPPVANG